MIVVIEQLNRSQWMASCDDGWDTGVGNWVGVVAQAIDWATLHGFRVEHRAWQETPLTLMRSEVRQCL